MKLIPLIFSLGLLGTACQTVESVSTSQFPKKSARKNMIQAESSSPIIFFIPFGTSYIDEAQENLVSQCQSPSRIEGTVSKHTSTNYFIGLFMSQKVELSGYCVASAKEVDKSDDSDENVEAKADATKKKEKAKNKKRKKGA